MSAASLCMAVRPAAGRLLVLAALLAVVADADARGRRSGSSRSTVIHIRSSGSGSSSSSGDRTQLGDRWDGPGGTAKTEPPMSPEEAARREGMRVADEREDATKAAERAAARKAAAEQAEAEYKAALAKKAAAEKAKADQLAAEQQKKRREEAAVVSDVDRVLLRAKADYPVLNTPEGQPVLGRIMERQKALAATGMYPSVAMVQAVADHEALLQPVARPQAAAAPATQVVEQTPGEQGKAIGGCRWVTPIQWACK